MYYTRRMSMGHRHERH